MSAGLKITSLRWRSRRSATEPQEVAAVPEGRVVELPPVLLRVEQAAKALGVGRSQVFEMIREGRLRSLKVGRRRLVPKSEIDRFVADQLTEED